MSKYTGGRERNHHPTSREDQATAASIQVGASAITIQQAEHEAEYRGTAASIQVGASAITIQQAAHEAEDQATALSKYSGGRERYHHPTSKA